MNRSNVLIIGGTSGIGLATAIEFEKSGSHVIGVGRSVEHIETARDETDGKNIEFMRADVSKEKEVKELVGELQKRSMQPNTLVNSVGTISGSGFTGETVEEWDRVMENSLRSVFLVCKEVVPMMKGKRSASIINISSVCGMRTCSSISYSVAKAGLDMLTKCMAKDLGSSGIRVNSVNPSVVESNLQMTAGLFDSEEKYEKWLEQMAPNHPIGKIGMPEDIAKAVVFLASEASSWTTGALLSVDGGRAVA